MWGQMIIENKRIKQNNLFGQSKNKHCKQALP